MRLLETLIASGILVFSTYLVLSFTQRRSSGKEQDAAEVRETSLSAKDVLSVGQKIFFALLLEFLLFSLVLAYFNSMLPMIVRFWINLLGVLLTLVSAVAYFGVLAYKLLLAVVSRRYAENDVIEDIEHTDLPTYSILVPLYREGRIIPQLIRKLAALDYPQDKLQILLLYEHGDFSTEEAIEKAISTHPGISLHRFKVPPHKRGEVRTKPRALNYGLQQATGEYCVIYDAEDRPEPQQLRHAVAKYRMLESNGSEINCLQARVLYDNDTDNWLTHLFAAEYAQQHMLVVSGLSVLHQFIPLSGTSYHCKTDYLRKMKLDSYNVTEDCDLGVRISRSGGRVEVLNSITFEKASPSSWMWIRQRSRWIKGFMQTYLVHMRGPRRLLQDLGWRKFVSFQILVAGATFTIIVSPLFWFLLVFYFLDLRLDNVVFFDRVIYTMNMPVINVLLFITALGNIPFVVSYAISPSLLPESARFSFRLWHLPLIALYWALLSIAAYVALFQLVTSPHYWDKSDHDYAV